MKSAFLPMFFFSACAAFAAPKATVTQIVTEGTSPEWVDVSYTLDADAVVTAQFYSDGIQIPDACVTRLYGDINRKVQATGTGSTRTFRWSAGAELGALRTAARNGNQLSVRLTAWPLGNPPLYMAVSLQATNVVRYYATEASVPGGVTNAHWKTGWLLMRHIYARNVTWVMGSLAGEEGRSSDEVAHSVMFSKDYYLGIYPITQRQCQAATGARTSAANTFEKDAACDFYPLNTWGYDTIKNTLIPRFKGVTKLDLDLPTEAEWEFACRAGTTTPYNFGTSSDISGKMWYGNSSQHTTNVDRFPPNGWGLYGMHGGIYEFCRDRYGEYPTGTTVVDPVSSSTAERVVIRGGSYAAEAKRCRSASRGSTTLTAASWDYGFRLMAPAVAP